MKQSWTKILGTLMIATLALSACGKKGGGSSAPPTGGDGGVVTPGELTAGKWRGYVQITDRQTMKKLFRDEGACRSSNCSFEHVMLKVELSGQPGIGGLVVRTLRTVRRGMFYGWEWSDRLSRFTQATSTATGFQLSYPVWSQRQRTDWDNGRWHCDSRNNSGRSAFNFGMSAGGNGWSIDFGIFNRGGNNKWNDGCYYTMSNVSSNSQMAPQVLAMNPQLNPQQKMVVVDAEYVEGTGNQTIRVTFTYEGKTIAVGDLTVSPY